MRWLCPTTSSRDCGRSASASGAAGCALPNRSLTERRSFFSKHVGALGRLEAELRRVHLGIAHEAREAQRRRLAEMVRELHRLDAGDPESHAHALESGLLVLRLFLA